MNIPYEESLSDSSKSYNDLYEDIEKSGGTLNMETDYKCSNNESSKKINVTNLIINGNGHNIDGSNKSSGFYFKFSAGSFDEYGNVTVNDLTLTNLRGFAIHSVFCRLTLNNVTFVNCSYVKLDDWEYPGVLELSYGVAILNNVSFKSNFNASCIGLDSSNMEINNSIFLGSNGLFSAITHNREH